MVDIVDVMLKPSFHRPSPFSADRPQIVRIGSRTSLSIIDGDSEPGTSLWATISDVGLKHDFHGPICFTPDRPHVVRVGSPDRCMASPIVDDSDQGTSARSIYRRWAERRLSCSILHSALRAPSVKPLADSSIVI